MAEQKPSQLSAYMQQPSPFAPRAAAARPAQASSPSTSKPTVQKWGGGQAAEEKPKDFLSGLIDFLSRPLYSQTERVDSVMDTFANSQRKMQQGDVVGALGESVGGALDIVGAPLRGLFSSDEADKSTTSQLIEKGTDVAGELYNPEYVDQVDNVNPVLKGVFGFAGDVAGDPLTWVPGAAIAKGVGTVGKLAREGATTARRASEAVQDSIAARRAERVADTRVDTPDIQAGAARAVPEAAEELPPGIVERPAAPQALHEALTDAPIAKVDAPLPPKVSELIAESPKAEKASKFLDTLSPKAAVDIARTAPRVLTKQPLPVDQWVEAVIKKEPTRPMALVGRDYLDATATQKLLADPATDPAVRQSVLDQVEEGHAQYVERIEANPKNWQAVDKATTNDASEILNRREMYQLLHSKKRETVEGALGGPLSSYLGIRNLSGAKFDSSVDELHRILKGEAPEIDEILDNAKLTAPVRKLASYLDIDIADTNRARLQATSNVGQEVPVTPESTMAKIAESSTAGDPDIQYAVKVAQDVLGDFLDVSSYTLRTKGGVKRTAEGVGEGLGKRVREFNTADQYTLTRRLMKDLAEEASKLNAEARKLGRAHAVKAGPARAAWMRERFIARAEMVGKILNEQGVPLWMGYGKEERKLYGFDQLVLDLAATAKTADDKAVLGATLFNDETSVAFTNAMDAAIALAHRPDMPVEEIVGLLRNTTKRNGKLGEIPNNITQPGRYGHIPATGGKKPRNAKGWQHQETDNGKGWYRISDPEHRTARFAELLQRAGASVIPERIAQNEADWIARFGAEANDLSKRQLADLESVIDNPVRLGEALRMIDDTPKAIRQDALDGGALDSSNRAAQELVSAAFPDGVQANASAAARAQRTAASVSARSGRASASRLDDATEAAQRAEQQAHFDATADRVARDEIDVELPAGVRDETVDVAEKWRIDAYRGIQAGIMSKADPLARAFNAKYGMEHLYDLHHSAGVLTADKMGKFHQRLSALNKGFSDFVPGTQTSYLQAAWKVVQNGGGAPDPRVAEAAEGLRQVASELFDLTGRAPMLGNAFFRNGAGLQAVNEAFANRGIADIAFELDLAGDVVRQSGGRTSLVEAAADQWRTWDIEDPLDFLSRAHDAMMQLNSDMSVAQSFTRMASKAGFLSSTPRPGYVRFATSEGGRSRFVRWLPTEMWVERGMAGELHRLEEVAAMTRTLDGEMGQFVHKYFDPIQNAWKYGITLPRPGHHIRNLIGDQSMTFVAEGVRKLKASSRDAFRVLGVRNDYDDVDILRSIQQLGTEQLDGVPSAGEVLSRGRYGNITNNDFYEAAQRHGLLPSYHVGEDYLDDVVQASALKTVADKVMLRGGRIEKAAGTVSEYRDHYSRLQHFLQYIYKAQDGHGGPKNLEELFETAAKQVKKYHPDGSMLSGVEGKYFRRLIPFYSWLRGALPAIIESTVTQPGRVLAFPKASYNLAVSMGVNPESLSEPFPEDGLFPSFLTEQVAGPVAQIGGKYFMLNPGIAHIDVANMLGPDPVRGIAGAVSPLLRAPAELLSGGTWGTGAKIKDESDYLDSSLPFINYISNISGNSVTGTIGNVLSGNVALDPQYQVAAGNKEGLDQALSLSNWLTGLGVQNISKPNYENFAEIEKRNRASEEK